MRFKFTNFINQNGLVELVEHSVCKYKGKKDHFIRITHGPRLNEQMKRIQEAGCVYIFSGILKDDNDKQEEYVIFGRVETKLFETDKAIRVGVPVETRMDGYLLFFAMDMGK